MEYPRKPRKMRRKAKKYQVAKIENKQAGQVIDKQARIDPAKTFFVRQFCFFYGVVKKKKIGKQREYDDYDRLKNQGVGIEPVYILEEQ